MQHDDRQLPLHYTWHGRQGIFVLHLTVIPPAGWEILLNWYSCFCFLSLLLMPYSSNVLTLVESVFWLCNLCFFQFIVSSSSWPYRLTVLHDSDYLQNSRFWRCFNLWVLVRNAQYQLPGWERGSLIRVARRRRLSLDWLQAAFLQPLGCLL